MTKIRLIVGLGNPGGEYEQTRHNAGFWFVDELSYKFKVTMRYEAKHQAIMGKFKYQDSDIFLIKPQTYMNLSGKSVISVMNFFKINSEELLVVHDELDFAPGVAKFKSGGGSGGHNGLNDIDRVIGKNYLRLRIGIGHPGDRHKVVDYVLKKASSADKLLIEEAQNKALNVMETVFAGELNIAMKQLHT
jgi:PTH1 family peptidyl-tRNA hydrolase